MQKLFFSGIGGSGMSALAVFMADRGASVSGSDRAFDRGMLQPLRESLRNRGITIAPQDGKGLDRSFDLVVFSTAVEPDNPDAVAARSLGLTVRTRPAFLADIVSSFKTCAVAGTSGKSTTAGMLAFLMRELGLQPNFIGGGRVKQFRTAGNPGNSLSGASDLLVIEACESDGTLVDYRPHETVLLNLALDHHPVSETAGLFRTLVDHTAGPVVANADDTNLTDILPPGTITFSLDRPSSVRPGRYLCGPLESEFCIEGVTFVCPLPGKHNLNNALSCIALLKSRGESLKDISPHLKRFKGIERRFDIVLNDGRFLVIDDYAHNPHKIAALIESVSRLSRRICYIFQPHGYGPTRLMKEEYCRLFSEKLREGDHLYLLPIFFAGGTTRKDISSEDLAAVIRASGKSATAPAGRDHILEALSRWQTYVVFGARDETLSDFARSIAEELSPRPIL
jgi:UDP-N-acetylmuramate--alanine ligase